MIGEVLLLLLLLLLLLPAIAKLRSEAWAGGGCGNHKPGEALPGSLAVSRSSSLTILVAATRLATGGW
jgi:hypothetical protein